MGVGVGIHLKIVFPAKLAFEDKGKIKMFLDNQENVINFTTYKYFNIEILYTHTHTLQKEKK